MLIAGFGRSGHAVGDIPGVRFKVVKVSGVGLLALFKDKKVRPWIEDRGPVVVLFCWVDGFPVGKHAHIICWWMNPRSMETQRHPHHRTSKSHPTGEAPILNAAAGWRE